MQFHLEQIIAGRTVRAKHVWNLAEDRDGEQKCPKVEEQSRQSVKLVW